MMNTKDRSAAQVITRRTILIDSGVEYIDIRSYDFSGDSDEKLIFNKSISNNGEIGYLFEQNGVTQLLNGNDQISPDEVSVFITGKLSDITRKVMGKGEIIIPSAVLWSAADYYLKSDRNKNFESIGIIDLSASGYMIIALDRVKGLMDDALIVNPKCGAGTGVNLSRILEKLDMRREDVDPFLSDYLGDNGKEKRERTPVRADRCGVFSSSATISDKNQGIPLDYALAVTMKSEVNKSCNKIPNGVEKVYLTGGVFRWKYARDCAFDILVQKGVKRLVFDEDNSTIATGMKFLSSTLSGSFRKQPEKKLRKSDTLIDLPGFKNLRQTYEKRKLYKRYREIQVPLLTPDIRDLPVNIALDIGSTMAKMAVTDASEGSLVFKNSYDNHGDTISTIKYIFGDIKKSGIDRLRIQNIGITGSGRYQVQKALTAIYPHLADRIYVLVENYAHARGAVSYVRDHIEELQSQGINDVNTDFCLLVDIGGEDTKVSVISLEKEELFDNAMNVKCSAGTGSLMDTLKSLFGIEQVAEAYKMAFDAEKAYIINATCAVFLMENARKMQAEGFTKDRILASCVYAIVENMARTLWDQVDFPENTVVLLHGQTMLSDPLPLAVTHRIQEYTGRDTYCIVPPFPGHRACMGLIKSMEEQKLPLIDDYAVLDNLIEQNFDKRIFTCYGVACGDSNARCSRTLLTAETPEGKLKLKLGGCTAVNEMESEKGEHKNPDVPDCYRNIWNHIDLSLPRSEVEGRLVIPRSFAVSSHAHFFGRLFVHLDIPVYIDNVRENDVLDGQKWFPIDTCAPNIGATGQFLRLAKEEKGTILIPQIDFLPAEGVSLGRTCTTNQGGPLIALHFAEELYPETDFRVIGLSLDRQDPVYIAEQVYDEMKPVFRDYGKNISKKDLIDALTKAIDDENKLRDEVSEMVCDFLEDAIDKNKNISIVTGREYILNPGIYDSHTGKLLKDKGVYAIPSYAFDTYLNSDFEYMYWKNPHDILSKVNAITEKAFHKIIKHERLSEIVKRIETGMTDSFISVVTVSTFRCGPDSVTIPIVNELTRDYPSLLIQSDAMIAELAHLENRVNTHLNQLEKQLHDKLSRTDETDFKIELLNEFSLDALNFEKDVIYFPNLDDNRMTTAVFRAMGITVIDNFDDDEYDLEKKG